MTGNGPSAERRPNHLIHETSPYLLQHAHNPVDWYPWSDEAIERARAESKPIFLSIGYSACHWCHVMERESFEDEDIARFLNTHFVCIKVDREERPDLDEIYMAAVQMLTGSGGWPLNVFLTPELKPFYGGTYFPPRDAFGRPGFRTVLEQLVQAWNEQHDRVAASAEALTAALQRAVDQPAGGTGAPTADLIDCAVHELAATFDPAWGGFGDAPKFPTPANIALLLRAYRRTRDAHALDMATRTLTQMARGGLYDHLGGGFHRYSVDAQWLVPHFEKMLYDNALLVHAYLDAYQVTGNTPFATIARETLDYILRDMTDAEGGFFSSEDADSEGQEGAFYLWTLDAIREVLGDDTPLFVAYYGVEQDGTFPSREPYHAGKNILHVPRDPAVIEREFGLSAQELEARLAPLRAELLAIRSRRVRPGRDDKIITAWNALAISAMAKGYQVLEDTRYLDAAQRATAFITTRMNDAGGLLRTFAKGQAKLPAYLDDYAYLLAALVDLYEADFNTIHLRAAHDIVQAMETRFRDAAGGAYFSTGDEHRGLLARTRSLHDQAVPSANAVAAQALLRLGALTDNAAYIERAREIVSSAVPRMERAPLGTMAMLCAADFLIGPRQEIAIVGEAEDSDFRALLDVARRRFLPNTVIAAIDPDAPDAEAIAEVVPLLANRDLVDGRAAAYVCENYSCALPVTTPEALLDQLDSASFSR